MQCFKLVNAGFVDRVIVFDELPDFLLNGIKTREVAGFPRTWAKWLISIGSLRDVFKTETSLMADPTYTKTDGRFYFRYTPIGKEPCFYVLEYLDVNSDKDAWRAICEFLRMNVDRTVRLKEKIEDMAVPFADNPKSPLSIEPEDVPVISIPKDVEQPEKEIVGVDEQILVQEKKKSGRPKKVFAGV